MFGVSFFVALEPFESKGAAGAWLLLFVTEVIFMIDFMLRWFKVPKEMEDPTLKKTATKYLKRKCILDFFPTIISNILFMHASTRIWSYRLKLLRFARITYIRKGYIHAIKNYSNSHPKVKAIYKKLCDGILFTALITHILTCAWIRIGAVGYELPPAERESWLFQTGS